MSTRKKEAWKNSLKFLATGLGIGAAIIGFAIWTANDGKTADKGAAPPDLPGIEERIAELEATVARKGNRKASLKVSGQVNKDIVHWDVDGLGNDQAIVEGSQSETYVSISGEAKIRPDWAVGYTLEIGQGKTGLDIDLLTGISFGTDNDLYTRQSYVFFATPAGRVSIGQQSMATDDLVDIGVANTNAASKRLTVQPFGYAFISIGNAKLAEIELEPFNGEKADSIRFDSKPLAGFVASAAWETAADGWDAALKYSGELAGFKIAAAVGYEEDNSDTIALLLSGNVSSKTATVNLGVKHIVSGLFVQGSGARLDINGVETEAYHVQAGIEWKFIEIGNTTAWAEYADWEDANLSFYGLGLNQSLMDDGNGGSAADLYVLGRQYEVGGTDATSLLGGLRLKF